jgi:hypothetical protein
MPGVNALLLRFTRPDLAAGAPYASALPVLGILWLLFTVTLYWFAGINPIVAAITTPSEEGTLNYLNRTGITFTIIVFVAGILAYVVGGLLSRSRGVDRSLMYKQLPPD